MKLGPAPLLDLDMSLAGVVGSSTSPDASTQVPQPSSQSLESFDAWSPPRCCVHPGQAHCKPQQHPDPANEAIALSGGITGNSGIDEPEANAACKDLVPRIGGSSGPFVGGDR
ncbi:uncharacterized protein FIBRA_01985 [Fibroporia radiculosa]|uniref:Uncharacterized protein n=1 Tax=Fibroporia radiculosa TaxID=599839 RepID=J4GM15_9APHY|nr:uncharacterized protein FIBRA_01985 [Fibroporia radiculosa]CCL99960.1 predicted protein [Fibroporia radiculosa]